LKIKKIIPILDWLPSYKKADLKGDVIAGLTVGIVLIPQGIAYALIAGLPPIYGLYTALIPQIIYVFFGTARQVAIGPVAMDSLIVATGVSTLALVGSQSYISIAILLALVVGVMQLLMGILRLGFIVNFLSKPVITGFTSAVALTIGLNQLSNLFGVDFIKSDQIHILLGNVFDRISEINLNTTIIGLVACLIIVVLKKINKKIPNALIVVVLGILALRFFNDRLLDVAIVKDIPSGLPFFSMPELDIAQIRELMPIAITLVMVGYLEIISIGKTLESKQDEYRIDANQELIALGLGNIVGSLFKAYPSTSSFSRSAINEDAGAKTGMAAIVASVLVIFTLLYLTPVFYHLPKTVLAAIIIVSIVKLVNFKEAKFLWRANNLDFWLLLADEVLIEKDILVFRFDAQLFYANANYFRERLDDMASKRGNNLKLIVLDAESINRLDSTGVAMLKDRIKYYNKRNIQFYFAGVKGPVRDAMFKGGILEIIDLNHFFMRANGAVTYYKTGDNEHQKRYAQYIHQVYK